MLAMSLVASTSWLAAPSMGLKPNQATADQQQRRYFELAPWEKMPDPMRENEVLRKVFGGRPTTLDLRGFIQPFDRGGVVLGSVLVTQEGLKQQPAEKGMQKTWRVVGAIAVEGDDPEQLSVAVANQVRAVIEPKILAYIRCCVESH